MTSSSRFGEDLARAGAAPTPPEPLHGPTHYLLARLDAALARVINCVADRVFGAIDAALFQSWDLHDGADWLSDWEAEHEVHEPPTY